MTELLTSKTAILYGAGGDLGGAAARPSARGGATVYLAGRTREPLERVAADIAATGGRAHVAGVDALDEHAVGEDADAVAAEAGRIDVSFKPHLARRRPGPADRRPRPRRAAAR